MMKVFRPFLLPAGGTSGQGEPARSAALPKCRLPREAWCVRKMLLKTAAPEAPLL